jgi:phosphopantetheinyl transferase
MITTNEADFEKTEYLIGNSLDSISGLFKFEFCLVNMICTERKLKEKDLSLLSVLSEKEACYMEKLKIHKNRIQWVSGRYAVKSALFKYRTGRCRLMNPSCIDVLKGADSAPYILQYPDLCVSITHSFPYCIGIVSEKRIGVDIEKITEPEDSLIKHFYSIDEKDVLKCLKGTEEYSRQAMVFWTRKEAVSKLLRLGMQLDFKKIDTLRERILMDSRDVFIKSFVCKEFCVSIAAEI